MSYQWLVNLESLNFDKKSVLIIGSGGIVQEHLFALSRLKISDITVIGRTKEKVMELNKKFSCEVLFGGFENNLEKLDRKDLVIICTPIDLLVSATKMALKYGQNNILVEKPGSLYPSDLISLSKQISNQRVRIGYQRIFYPNFQKLLNIVQNEGGIKSCHFDFTEWIHTIDFTNNKPDAYSRWGISNSLHVISMVTELIGMPKKFSSYQSGTLEWHHSGSMFVGSGISEKNIPFSYHSNWKSGGRWFIDVMTEENVYRLMPLEELQRCQKGKVNWETVKFEKTFQDTKQGLAEELAIMLNDDKKINLDLVTPEKAAKLNLLAEKIFGY